MTLDGPHRRPPCTRAVLVAFCAGFAIGQFTACATQGPPVVWPIAIDCAAKDAATVIGTVTRILIGGREGWRDELEELARKVGPDLVSCALGQLVADWAGGAAALDNRTQAARVRAEAFLGERHIEVRR